MNDDRKPGIYAEDPAAPGGERQVQLTVLHKGKMVALADEIRALSGPDFEVIAVDEMSTSMAPAELKLTGTFSDGSPEDIMAALLRAERIITGAQFAVWLRGKLFGCYAVNTKADAVQAARDEFFLTLGSNTRNARRLADKAARNFKVVSIS